MSNLTFTLNQVEMYAIANARTFDFIFAYREFMQIKAGIYFSEQEMYGVLKAARDKGDYSILKCVAVSLFGDQAQYLDFQDLEICVLCTWALVDLKLALRGLREGRKAMKDVRKARSNFVKYLSLVSL